MAQETAIEVEDERTARTFLNLHLVLLYQKGRHTLFADEAARMRFIAQASPSDPRLSEMLQTTGLTSHLALQYLGESFSEIEQAEARQLTPLVVPIPPNLETTLGYPCQGDRNARYLGFHYTTADKPWWEDGMWGQTDSWSGYLAWINSWIVFSGLGSYRDNLGYAESPATHELILDRHTRLLYVTECKQGRAFLQAQWPKQDDRVELSQEELEARVAQIAERVAAAWSLPPEAVMARMQAERQEVARLNAWLKRFWPGIF